MSFIPEKDKELPIDKKQVLKTEENLNQNGKVKEVTAKVLIIGTSGVGKTTICYNIVKSFGFEKDKKRAISSDSPLGVTLEFNTYFVKYKDVLIELIDTCGLNEVEEGSVPLKEAFDIFLNFLGRNKNGFNLVYLVSSKETKNTYDLLKTLIPDNKIHSIIQETKKGWEQETCICKKLR